MHPIPISVGTSIGLAATGVLLTLLDPWECCPLPYRGVHDITELRDFEAEPCVLQPLVIHLRVDQREPFVCLDPVLHRFQSHVHAAHQVVLGDGVLVVDGDGQSSRVPHDRQLIVSIPHRISFLALLVSPEGDLASGGFSQTLAEEDQAVGIHRSEDVHWRQIPGLHHCHPHYSSHLFLLDERSHLSIVLVGGALLRGQSFEGDTV
mmetsp:Transcript_33959/g.52929  ORF Transcript_33959/g.52929 Transcript_33959/m.52929 type:complete len:206 (+) Transcript_33959:437-1054(+)